MYTVGNPWLWFSFAIVVTSMLALDLLIQEYAEHKPPSLKKVALWSLLWVLLALIFNGLFWLYLVHTENRAIADTKAMAFLTGYLLEKTLAVDNIFIWLMLFNYFSIPFSLQRRLLTWGILGAIGLRAVMVFAGSALIHHFQWLLYIFGVFLLFTGIKIALSDHNAQDVKNWSLVHWLYRNLRISNKMHGSFFFIRCNGLLFATPLFLALIMVELSDIIFSLDSIPALLSLTTDPFILLTSNVFAILGLRAMYFVLANIAERFSLLKYGLAVILIFIGIKMLIADIIYIPIVVSLAMVVVTLSATLLLNVRLNHLKNHS